MRKVDRILATSDLHGQEKQFSKLLKKMAYDPAEDLLIVCGDLIDRGTENLKCLTLCEDLKKQGAIFLKGNHEQFLESSLIEMITIDNWRTKPSINLQNWVGHNGGATMYKEISDLSTNKLSEILKFVQTLPLYVSIGKFIFTHAGANINKPIETNTEDETVWMKKSFPFQPAYRDKVIIFGHTPTWQLQPNKIIDRKYAEIWYDTINKDKLCVDCGGVFGGRLAAIELPSHREFYG